MGVRSLGMGDVPLSMEVLDTAQVSCSDHAVRIDCSFADAGER